ncbi:MAG: hypothetical protein RBT76_12005 [candidate division Zixibacteria bacterium]|nr:hypothetical protein [candidate division Zixibacteria bacterium]
MSKRLPLVFFLVVILTGVLAVSQTVERICARCGGPIEGAWLEVEGEYYHPDHFTCAYCDRPITGSYTVSDGKPYHTSCYERHIALRCAHCGDIINGQYLIDHWGNAYHPHHERDAVQCKYCGRFISDHLTWGGTTYRDGRHICGLCLESAIAYENEALSVLSEVVGRLAEIGIFVDTGKLNLHLVDLRQMQSRFGSKSHNLRGFVDYREKSSLFGAVKEQTIDVYLLEGMPRLHVATTLAHELTHVWQYEHGQLANDMQFSEGSCNYAAFLVLLNYPGEETAYVIESLLEDEDPVYGEGFRRVMAYAESVGTDAWLERLRENDKLPSGY